MFVGIIDTYTEYIDFLLNSRFNVLLVTVTALTPDLIMKCIEELKADKTDSRKQSKKNQITNDSSSSVNTPSKTNQVTN